MNGKGYSGNKYSRGFSLMELLVSMTLSIVVSSTMLLLMMSTLSSTGRIIKMTRLTDDLRITMQMMSRDVRRSNYTENSVNCFANPDCVSDGSITAAGDVIINNTGDCLVFHLERSVAAGEAPLSAGGFRRAVANGVGVIQMWTGTGMADCSSPENPAWVNVTDPDHLSVTSFQVDDGLSYSEVIFDDGAGNQNSQKVRKLRMIIGGELVVDANIHREIEDVIKLRNNLYL
jgi:Tfp pilus assembly protein PilW